MDNLKTGGNEPIFGGQTDPRTDVKYWRELLVGRTIESVQNALIPADLESGWEAFTAPFLEIKFTDGTAVYVLDGWGFTPIIDHADK
jgi:hypothetical protein